MIGLLDVWEADLPYRIYSYFTYPLALPQNLFGGFSQFPQIVGFAMTACAALMKYFSKKRQPLEPDNNSVN